MNLNIITLVLGGIVIFFIGREIVAWYFKTNKIIVLLESIEENTRPRGVTHDTTKDTNELI